MITDFKYVFNGQYPEDHKLGVIRRLIDSRQFRVVTYKIEQEKHFEECGAHFFVLAEFAVDTEVNHHPLLEDAEAAMGLCEIFFSGKRR